MGENIDVVFLGVNDAGMRVYDWLCERSGVFVHSLLTTKEQLKMIEDIQPDFVISCGYPHIVPKKILDIPDEGCLNLHPAYLPYNRGANPNVWSIVEGTPAGVTLHWMDSGIDTGDIIARRTVETGFTDTGRDLHERLEEAQVKLFQEIWPDVVSGNVPEIKQSEEKGTYHRTEEFEEICQLDPDETVCIKNFLDRLRALTFPPYDNAEIEIEGETYYVEVDITK
ncbi:formyltransferase family protein [Halobacterium salinarum]|uniref:methionyl-tRNA formyltransferase n=1 Tax=Halobacterium salinarum TaxID=2242 RepID=UPI002554DF0C|nr:formyltransferase family protein [Halobacterium salinarum]MDL0119329.1 formyltransferase family protein [Halobacterium salinarum]